MPLQPPLKHSHLWGGTKHLPSAAILHNNFQKGRGRIISPVETTGGILSGKNVISKLELALTPELNTPIHRDSGCGNFKELE